MSASCLYEGTVRHRRVAPATEFRHRLGLAYVDLDELPGLLGGRLVRPGIGTLRFRRRDYLGDRGTPLDTAVRDVVAHQTGERPGGPIRLLTQLRSFGICFNPVSFYYCFEADGTTLNSLIAEVTNTPWGERHAYVVPAPATGSRILAGEFDKELHVSPFMGMDHQYTCRATTPGRTLSVHIESDRRGERAFDATLSLRRRELTRRSAASIVSRYPAASTRVLALIYGHALGLRLAGAQPFSHPKAAA